MSEPDPLPLALDLSRAVHDAGGRALIVGGWVRDRLLGHAAKDIDVEVYGLEAPALKQTLARFGSVNTVGESFTVYKVGDKHLAARSNEFGYANYELTHPVAEVSPLSAAPGSKAPKR